MIVRILYNFLFYLILPFLVLRLFWRSLRQRAYRQRIHERFGFYPIKFEKCIWVHAVSVGEVLAAIPLIKSLKSQYPSMPLVVTTMTPTGAERVNSAFGTSVVHLYIPYDFSGAVKRFLATVNPKIAIIMETELWPNLLHYCHELKVPVYLVNARLSEKSAQGYQRIAELSKTMLRSITMIAAHGDKDAERFISLGAVRERVSVTGNIKFDIDIPEELIKRGQILRAELGNDRFIWVAASTHEGEEEVILAAHKMLREVNPKALLVLVPRHPNRFDSIAKLCSQHFATSRRSKNEVCTDTTGVYLGDTMGELVLLYSASDVAFVGGSLIPRGGHNILEAGALAKPILTGFSLYNFAEISEKFVSAQALFKVKDAEELAKQLIGLMQDSHHCAEVGRRSLAVVTANKGALQKQVALINRALG